MLRLCEIGQGDDRERMKRKKERATNQKASGFCGCQMMDDGIGEAKEESSGLRLSSVQSDMLGTCISSKCCWMTIKLEADRKDRFNGFLRLMKHKRRYPLIPSADDKTIGSKGRHPTTENLCFLIDELKPCDYGREGKYWAISHPAVPVRKREKKKEKKKPP